MADQHLITTPPLRIVVMGVCGSGKSTVARALADALHIRFVEGDDLHSALNIMRMQAGVSLTDEDRSEWLHALAAQLLQAVERSEGVVVACSALKRSYRDLFRRAATDVRFVFLDGEPGLLAQRLKSRGDHFMPLSLLQSQLGTLEPPAAGEAPIRLDISRPCDSLVAEALHQLAIAPS